MKLSIGLMLLCALLSLPAAGCAVHTYRIEEGPSAATVERESGKDETTGFNHQVLTYRFPQAVKEVATGDFYTPAASYPALPVDPKYTHVLSFQMSPMMPPRLRNIAGNGPLILYSDDLEVLVFSPLDHFFISLISFQDGRLHHGIEGEVEEIPAGFTHRFLLVEGQGINATVEHWGNLLRAAHHSTRRDRYADVGLSYLGYWTDNGAYYYYRTEPGMTEEEVLLAIKAEADRLGIPYGYLQIDSWFYYKKPGFPLPGGVTRWEPRPEKFPHGLTGLHALTGLPLITHNRWIDRNNDYSEKYPLALDGKMAIPTDRQLFDHWAENAASWGVTTYEQDWLMPMYWGNRHLRNGVDHAETYMQNLTEAMAARGLTMQICMCGMAHVMDAVDHPGITTVRSSIDYQRDISKESYWPQFHINNLVVWAVGIWPFKDNFQSAEKHGEAEALISTLSAGMVGPADRLGAVEVDIVNRTCRRDGLLLKPDKPATPIDAMFLPHQRPFITATYSQHGGKRWIYLASYLLAAEHPQRHRLDRLWCRLSYDNLQPGDFFPFPDQVTDWHIDLPRDLGATDSLVLYNWITGEAEVVDYTFTMKPIKNLYDFSYYVLAPIYDNNLALLGETDKFVTLADKRFTAIEPSADALTVHLIGAPGEHVTLKAYDAAQMIMLPPASVKIGADGTATVVLSR